MAGRGVRGLLALALGCLVLACGVASQPTARVGVPSVTNKRPLDKTSFVASSPSPPRHRRPRPSPEERVAAAAARVFKDASSPKPSRWWRAVGEPLALLVIAAAAAAALRARWLVCFAGCTGVLVVGIFAPGARPLVFGLGGALGVCALNVARARRRSPPPQPPAGAPLCHMYVPPKPLPPPPPPPPEPPAAKPTESEPATVSVVVAEAPPSQRELRAELLRVEAAALVQQAPPPPAAEPAAGQLDAFLRGASSAASATARPPSVSSLDGESWVDVVAPECDVPVAPPPPPPGARWGRRWG